LVQAAETLEDLTLEGPKTRESNFCNGKREGLMMNAVADIRTHA